MKKKIVAIALTATFILASCVNRRANKKREMARSYLTQASLDITTYNNQNDSDSLRKALNNIDESINYYPTIAARGMKATLLFQLGKLPESKKLFEELLKEKKLTKAKRADTLNNYAIVLYQLGQTAAAQQTWRDLINNPHYISPELAYFNLGYVELNEAAHTQAEQKKEIAEKHLHNALSYFKSAITISREYIDAYFFTGQTLISLNKIDEARDYFKTILTINPEHTNAISILKSLENA